MTLPAFLTVGRRCFCLYLSKLPGNLRTLVQPAATLMSLMVDSSENITDNHLFSPQLLYLLQKFILESIIYWVNNGFLAGTNDLRPRSLTMLCLIVLVVTEKSFLGWIFFNAEELSIGFLSMELLIAEILEGVIFLGLPDPGFLPGILPGEDI